MLPFFFYQVSISLWRSFYKIKIVSPKTFFDFHLLFSTFGVVLDSMVTIMGTYLSNVDMIPIGHSELIT